jgi:hypothetical protein
MQSQSIPLEKFEAIAQADDGYCVTSHRAVGNNM